MSPHENEYTVPSWRSRIVATPEVLVGKPVIKGTRLGVAFLLGLMAQGWREDDILADYPGLEREDLRACLAYASERLERERGLPPPPPPPPGL